MTIHDIKSRTQENLPHYFSRKTMRFFGQTLKDFSVRKFGDSGKYLMTAPIKMNGKIIGHSRRLFNPETNKLESVPND